MEKRARSLGIDARVFVVVFDSSRVNFRTRAVSQLELLESPVNVEVVET